MTTKHTQNELWQDILNCTRLSRYYAVQAESYRRKHGALQGVLFLSATGGVMAALDVLPPMMGLAANLAVAVCAVLSFLQDYGRKAAVLYAISSDCRELEEEWKTLWHEQSALDDNTAHSQNSRLNRRLDMVTERSEGVPVDTKLNRQCQAEAYDVLEAYYAPVHGTE
jgi:hypothetical protein